MRFLVLTLAGCAVLGGGKNKDGVECNGDCPIGTRLVSRSSSETVDGTIVWLTESECEALCEPEVACQAPNVPRVTEQGGQDVFECVAVAGFSSEIPPLSELDLSFGSEPVEPLHLPVTSSLGAPVAVRDLVDLNGDGKEDMIAFQPSTWDIVHALSNGDGTFTLDTFSGRTDPWPASIAAADMDEDGVLDIVGWHQNWGVGSWVAWWRGVGDGTYLPADNLTGNIGPRGVEVVDADADGHLDVVTGTASQGVQFYFGLGDGTFAAPVQVGVGSAGFALGDVDDDGRLDVATNLNGGNVYTQGTARSFTEVRSNLMGAVSGVYGAPLLVDLDGDGLDDWVISTFGGACPAEQCVQAALAQPGGDFVDLEPTSGIFAGNPDSHLAGPFDFDGDGLGDFLEAVGVENILIVPRGARTPYPMVMPFPSFQAVGTAAGDIDGDGIDEIVGTGELGGTSVDVEVLWL